MIRHPLGTNKQHAAKNKQKMPSVKENHLKSKKTTGHCNKNNWPVAHSSTKPKF